MPDDATEGVAEHSFLSCNRQSTFMPQLYSLNVQLLLYPMYILAWRNDGPGKPCAVDRASYNIGTPSGLNQGLPCPE